jgi:hypothetical protein
MAALEEDKPMKKLALLLTLAVALAGTAQANMIVDGTMDNPATVKDSAAVGDIATGTWYVPGEAGWNKCWRIEGGVGEYGYANTYNQAIVQLLDIAAGSYTLSFDVNNVNQPDYGSYFYVGVQGDAETLNMSAPVVDGDNRVHEGNLSSYEGQGWQTVALPFDITAAQATTYDKIVIAVTGNGSGELYVDNFSLVPEPATMSLLALGGLVALRKRR